MDKYEVYTCHGILRKEGNPVTCYSTDEPQGHAKLHMLVTKEQIYMNYLQ